MEVDTFIFDIGHGQLM